MERVIFNLILAEDKKIFRTDDDESIHLVLEDGAGRLVKLDSSIGILKLITITGN